MALLLPRGASSVTVRCMARVSVVRPSPDNINCNYLAAARSLCTSSTSLLGASPSPPILTSSGRRAEQSSTLSDLNASLAGISLQNSIHRRSLSSNAQPEQQQQPLGRGEPITFLTLNNLADNPGAVKKKRRIGRGIGSSKGKTCGRGHKGQKARAGRGVHPTFEGGQTKFYKRLPKKGKLKNSKFKLELIPVNVGQVQNYVTMGRLKAERSDGVITMRDMVRAGMFPNSSVKSGVKLLGDGAEWVKDPLLIEVPWASASAIEAIESAGGFVTTVHYNTLAIRAHLKPHKFALKPEAMVTAEGREEGAETDVHDAHLLPRRARPPPKYMPYYTDYAKRGYLNPRVQLERKNRGLKEILLTH